MINVNQIQGISKVILEIYIYFDDNLVVEKIDILFKKIQQLELNV